MDQNFIVFFIGVSAIALTAVIICVEKFRSTKKPEIVTELVAPTKKPRKPRVVSRTASTAKPTEIKKPATRGRKPKAKK
jgi:hypothetical protein